MTPIKESHRFKRQFFRMWNHTADRGWCLSVWRFKFVYTVRKPTSPALRTIPRYKTTKSR